MPRLDQEMMRRGLAGSRARAQALIAAGAVAVAGKVARKAAQAVGEDTEIAVTKDPNPYVSRGGLKLAHGLDVFGIDPSGRLALDLGASTGGFTEVLLRRGARHVHAVDVGHGQLHAKLREDDKCTALERQDVRMLTQQMVGQPELIVGDLAFISLTKALPVPMELAAPGARMVVLVKPQFESEPGAIGKGGIVRNPEAHKAALERVEAFVDAQGWTVLGTTTSPVEGGDGNREFLLAAQKPD